PILAPETGILESVDTPTVELFTSLLAIIALGGGLLYVLAARLVPAGVASPWAAVPRAVADELHRLGLWLAWSIAAVATAGSLYFSEVADYVPCRLCWFQRICMYPLAGILLVAAARNDRSVRWYALPLLLAGIGISAYHYLIEWRPAWGEGACGIGPSCTDVWFRRLGFMTLAGMALSGFLAMLALLFVRPRERGSRSER
ncbi:MAG: disulfide bond formation protein B, partial [Actinomycetota bacterium]